MIYFTSLIFTLFLLHITRAVPACGDVASFEDQYDTYGDELVLADYKVTWNDKYDNPNGDTRSVTCSGLARSYPHFGNFPDFPYIGGAYDTRGSSNCGKCWKLTNRRTGRWIYFTSIDGAGGGYNIGKRAYIALNGGTGSDSMDAEAQSVPGHFCGFK